MSDLISRDDAIEALRRAEALTRAFGYHNVYDAIRDVPSAEPEIIHCRDCAWWRKNPVRLVNRCAIFDTDTSMTFYCKHGRKENE